MISFSRIQRQAAEDLSAYLDYDFRALEAALVSWSEGEGREDASIWTVSEILCPSGLCPAFTETGALVYLDSVHLTLEAARMLASSDNAPVFQ